MSAGVATVREIAEDARVLYDQLCISLPFTGEPAADAGAIQAIVAPADDIATCPVEGTSATTLIVFHKGLVDVVALASLVADLRADAWKPSGHVALVDTPKAAVDAILAGAVLLLRRGHAPTVISLAAALNPPQPQDERLVRGPRQALTAHLDHNLALIRNMVQRRALRVELRPVNADSRSKLAIVYLEGQADPAVRQTLMQRLDSVAQRTIFEVTMLQPALADDPLSPFVNVQLTERVDMCALGLLNGRHVVLAAGSAQALVLPATWPELMSSPEDRYLPRYMADANRVIRYASAFVALTLESAFIAVTTVNQELLPTPLAYAIARSRVGVPLPPVAEVVLMAIVIEILREAAVRLPAVLSQTIAIVGALVIGQAVVQASLISAPVIVLVALVALASFVVPQYEAAVIIRFLRFPAMLCAAVLGIYGLTLFFMAILLHMAGLRSFGRPYLAPVASREAAPFWTLVRAPPWIKARLA